MAADAAGTRDIYLFDEMAAVPAPGLDCAIEATLSGKKSGNELSSDI